MMKKKMMLLVTGVLVLAMSLSAFVTFAAADQSGTRNSAQAKKGFFRKTGEKGKPGQKMDLETLKTKLAEKVAAGKITQEEADKLIAAFEEREAKRAEMKAKFDSMTEEEKAAYKEKMQKDKSGKNGEPRQKMDLETLKAKLAEKVSAGEITQEEADKLIAAFEEREAKRAEMKAKCDSMTEEEKAQFKQEMKEKRQQTGKQGKRGGNKQATVTPAPAA